jgi:hypothetical protein
MPASRWTTAADLTHFQTRRWIHFRKLRWALLAIAVMGRHATPVWKLP